MATFYCVGFPDLANTWARSGHVSNHEIFLTEDEAKKANEGLITCVHEYLDSLLDDVDSASKTIMQVTSINGDDNEKSISAYSDCVGD